MLNAKRGEMKQGFLKVVNSDCEIPITEILGFEGDFTVVILGGIHAGEYVGVETAINLSKLINPTKLKGRVIIANPINIHGFYAKVQHVNPIDDKNCNRAFPGDKDGTLTDKIGFTIEKELFSRADFLLDLHGGDLHEELIPFCMYAKNCDEEVMKIAKKGASALGIELISGVDFPQTAIGRAGELGIPSVISFVGGDGIVDRAQVKNYCDGVINLLKVLGMYEGEAHKIETIEFKKLNIFYANCSGCWSPEVIPGEMVKKEQLIGTITDFFGNIKEEFYATEEALVLCVITSFAINKGDSLYELDR